MKIRLAVFAVKKIREGFSLFQIITGPLFTLIAKTIILPLSRFL